MDGEKREDKKQELHKMIDNINDELFIRLLIAMIQNHDTQEKSNIN